MDMIMSLIDACIVNQENIFSNISALKIDKKALDSVLLRKNKLPIIQGLELQSQVLKIILKIKLPISNAIVTFFIDHSTSPISLFVN